MKTYFRSQSGRYIVMQYTTSLYGLNKNKVLLLADVESVLRTEKRAEKKVKKITEPCHLLGDKNEN